ncbi:DNA starvation/stationary phase protection protein [Phenylobacterium sp. Root77]|jgi:starvation-inducible DNA-binding protein|uniref:Dps family protein n=1 Tax=unclassified Phenylobacterium TaxID=2640670 RepID=UPI0006FFE216|nr:MULTISPECIES: Dps family protein [unclassified Phenylobacterium]KQW71083.1 DNA starvation/stationary phase protection protein [Phenylobacterium sp. Root1277]KQW95758.1 DNA starvation/stationary phase protection protein [Phenylobacterium sp. Root1290]KRC41544.1 DNA starvation/stationary phase protection protein [Phenylobacterium sp. Root77]
MTNTGPSAKDRKAVAEGLSKLLADTYAVYLKTHGYHWNVSGPNFSQLHALFMAQYTEMWTAIDEVAERIRALGERAPQGYGAFGNLSSIKDGDPSKNAEEMLKDLVASQETLVSTLYAILPTAQQAGDEVSASLISDRLTAHEKHIWMLRSSL